MLRLRARVLADLFGKACAHTGMMQSKTLEQNS
jgi:hypothetical protein